MTKSTHGGQRKGAGRPSTGTLPVRAVRLSDAHAEVARLIGKGDMSAGLRAALERSREWREAKRREQKK